MTGTPERIRAARGAWLAAIAALEVHRLEVNRLWLEYLDLADPERARKIRRILEAWRARRSQDGRRVVSGCGVPCAGRPT